MTQSPSGTRPSAPPPSYKRRLSIADFVFVVARFGGIWALLVVFMTYILVDDFMTRKTVSTVSLGSAVIVGLLATLVAGWFIYREWYAHTHNIPQVDNVTAVMTVRRKGPWALGLASSSDDTYLLTEMKIVTPDRKWWQRRLLFDCDNLVLQAAGSGREPVVLRNVKDVDHILAIQRYVKSLASTQTQLAEENNRLLRQTVALLAQQNQLIRDQTARPQSQPSPASVPTPVRYVLGSDGVFRPANE